MGVDVGEVVAVGVADDSLLQAEITARINNMQNVLDAVFMFFLLAGLISTIIR